MMDLIYDYPYFSAAIDRILFKETKETASGTVSMELLKANCSYWAQLLFVNQQLVAWIKKEQ